MDEAPVIDIPVYKSVHYVYIRISDLPEQYEQLELAQWIKGKLQPLIQAEGKGNREIQDAVFLVDYYKFLDYKAGKYVLID